MHLVLLRHAERLLSSMDRDATLNARGELQAQNLVDEASRTFPQPTKIWTSPKRRTQQTVALLAAKLGIKVLVKKDLDERASTETPDQFSTRVQNVLQQVAQSGGSPTVLICSHADWLAEAVTIMDSNLPDPEFESHFAFCQFRIFERQEGLWIYHANWKGGSSW